MANEVVEALEVAALGRSPRDSPQSEKVPVGPASVPAVGDLPRRVPGEE